MEGQMNKQQDNRDVREKPLCIFLNIYYDKFLQSHYAKNSHLISASYSEQMDSLQGECFGDSDFYSEGLKQVGWNAEDLVVNCLPLQQAWAEENGFSGQGLDIAIEQIRRAKPDVLYFQVWNVATKEFISAIRPYTKLIVGQIASPIPSNADISSFDVVFSSFPHFVRRFQQIGIAAHYMPLSFEPRILQRLQGNERPYPVTFVGGISNAHAERKEFLHKLSKLTPIDFFGYGVECMPENSPLRKRYHGQAWGMQMFSVFRSSLITINHHIDVAEDCANNMRLFEATGCGALLITDHKNNLNELFEIGTEVIAYNSPQECADLVKYYLENPEQAYEIAQAGQARTLSDHTFAKRMERIAEILKGHLSEQRERKSTPILTGPENHNNKIPTRKIATQTLKSSAVPPYPRHMTTKRILEESAIGFCKKANLLIEQNDFSAALAKLNEAMYFNTGIRELHYARAYCLLKMGRVEESAVAANAELKAYPENNQCRKFLREINSGSVLIQNSQKEAEYDKVKEIDSYGK